MCVAQREALVGLNTAGVWTRFVCCPAAIWETTSRARIWGRLSADACFSKTDLALKCASATRTTTPYKETRETAGVMAAAGYSFCFNGFFLLPGQYVGSPSTRCSPLPQLRVSRWYRRLWRLFSPSSSLWHGLSLQQLLSFLTCPQRARASASQCSSGSEMNLSPPCSMLCPHAGVWWTVGDAGETGGEAAGAGSQSSQVSRLLESYIWLLVHSFSRLACPWAWGYRGQLESIAAVLLERRSDTLDKLPAYCTAIKRPTTIYSHIHG